MKPMLQILDPVHKDERIKLGTKEDAKNFRKLQHSLEIWGYDWILSYICQKLPPELKI
jgi:hypothetical protein